MSKESGTEVLRRMLYERGVENQSCEVVYEQNSWLKNTVWDIDVSDPLREVCAGFDEFEDGATLLRFWNATPEQAVEATLGRGTCRNVHEPPKTATFWPSPHFKCSECGEVHVSMQYVYYCPNCGRKVVDE